MIACPSCGFELSDDSAFCSKCGAKPAAPVVIGEGERKLVTVMFADLSGFTALSETLDPEDVRALVNDCFDVLVPVIERCGGTVDKFIGDEVMALFGAPVAHEDDAVRCVFAARELMEAFASFAASRGLDLGIHVGIETGTVVTGGLGSRGREEYSVIGDAVNLAARLADASEAGQVLIGPTARHLAGDGFEFQELEPLRLKGKSMPVAVHLLRTSEPPGTSRRYVAGLTSPLVGRSVELGVLRAAVERLLAGSGTVVAISGEPGLGKSRLIAELRAGSPTRIRWVEGRGQAYGQTSGYAVAVGLLDELLLVPAGSRPTHVEAALRQAVAEAIPDPEAAGEVYPYLAQLRGLPLRPQEEERVRHLAPEALHGRLRSAFVRFLGELAGRRPLALVWEDLHWADPSSLGLIEALLPLTTSNALLLLLIFRPHERSVDEWYTHLASSGIDLARLDLTPLDERDSGALVGNLLGVEGLPEVIERLILEKAEGNPFFVEELLRSLIDGGLLHLEGGRVVAARSIERLAVPDTLQGVVAARIDALRGPDKVVLQTAAVVGRVFQRPVLARLCTPEGESPGGGEGVLDDSLERLLLRELIRRRPRLEYLFKHAVTQDVAYNSLLLARRRELHAATAEAIERLYPERRDELAATLAHHYRQAGVHDRALRYLLRAAARARRTYSNAEALELYGAALEEVPHGGTAQAADIEESIADLLRLANRREEAGAHYEAALAHVAPGEELVRARLLRRLAGTSVALHQADDANAALDDAEQALGTQPAGEAPGWWSEWADIQTDRMWLYYWLDDAGAMGPLMENVASVLERPALRRQRTALLYMLVLLELRRSRFRSSTQAVAWADEYMALTSETGDLGEEASGLSVDAFVRMWRDDLDGAETRYREALPLVHRIGDVTNEVRVLTYLTVIQRRRGATEAARDLAVRSLEAASAAGLPEYVGTAHGNLAWVAWRDGDMAATEDEGQAAMAALYKAPSAPFRWLALWPLMAATLRSGRDAEALDCSRMLLEPSQMQLPADLETALLGAVSAWNCDEPARARDLMAAAVESARASGWGWL